MLGIELTCDLWSHAACDMLTTIMGANEFEEEDALEEFLNAPIQTKHTDPLKYWNNVLVVMNGLLGAYSGTSISFSGQFTSHVIPIVLRCIVTRPLFISTIAPIVPMSLLSRTLLFSLPFPRP